MRMVELPIDESRDLGKQVLFPRDELWVPVCVVNENVHILPGVPRLCMAGSHRQLKSLRSHIHDFFRVAG
jgi:hypothetical protein